VDLLAATAYSDADLAKLLGTASTNAAPALSLTFAILVPCEDENAQAALMAQFDDLGIEYRALMT